MNERVLEDIINNWLENPQENRHEVVDQNGNTMIIQTSPLELVIRKS
jgi:hypothetical protein